MEQYLFEVQILRQREEQSRLLTPRIPTLKWSTGTGSASLQMRVASLHKASDPTLELDRSCDHGEGSLQLPQRAVCTVGPKSNERLGVIVRSTSITQISDKH